MDNEIYDYVTFGSLHTGARFVKYGGWYEKIRPVMSQSNELGMDANAIRLMNSKPTRFGYDEQVQILITRAALVERDEAQPEREP